MRVALDSISSYRAATSTTSYASGKAVSPANRRVQEYSDRRGEQYWASRALVAETMLAARVSHDAHVQDVTRREEMKRQRDLAAAASVSEARHSMLEKTVLLLVASVAVLVLVIIYLAISSHSSNSSKHKSPWIALPSHFTIPILSPFTSVIEHETSAISTRTVATAIVALTCLAYFMFRHWLHRRSAT